MMLLGQQHGKKINEMTKDVVGLFYTKDNLDWDKVIDYVSKK